MTAVSTAFADDDAHLVARSLTGDREAFALIVARYQALVCAIAYSGTGNLAESEELAQETFVAAWRQLDELREVALLKAWLCGIARNLVHNAVRRRRRDAVHAAKPLDAALEAPAAEPLPVDQAISREQEGILWRTLEAIPETYREPLVLFYREHQSIDRVARALGLSEDVVRQRLARGRKALAEQVLAFVEGTLERSAPGSDFTRGVVAALPPAMGAASIGSATAAAAKGVAVAKSAGAGLALSALFGLGTGAFGAWSGLRTGLDIARTPRERALTIRTWKVAVAGSVAFGGASVLLVGPVMFWSEHAAAFVVAAAAVGLGFAAWMTRMTIQWIGDQRTLRAEETRARPEAFVDRPARRGLDHRSQATFLGLPLWHVRLDAQGDETGPVVAWVAVGDTAVGALFALGQLAVGPVSVGTVSAGIVTVGCVSAGVVPIGAVSFGVLAMGTLCAGVYALGAVAFGWTAAAGTVAFARDFAYGRLAFAGHADDAIAGAFFARMHAETVFHALMIVTVVVLVAPLVGMRILFWRSRAKPSLE